MARTSRNQTPAAASVDALDNLNLDDMFADEGDALFDGLDIDLDQMDDITGGPIEDNSATAAAPLADQTAPARPAAPPPAPEELPKRRKTKRKTKSPVFFDDDDDDYVEAPAKKKKKGSKKGSPKKKSSKKSSVSTSAGERAPTTKSRSKSRNASTMPPPVSRASAAATSSAGGVAGAGPLGGRQSKRTTATLPRASSAKSKAPARVAVEAPAASSKIKSSHRPPPASAAAAAAAAATTTVSQSTVAPAPLSSAPSTLPQVQAMHPGLAQDTYCGLSPSNTLFYPFMPALPSQPSLKNRKIYALIDRIHSSFTSHMASTGSNKQAEGILPARESEAIFQLLQDSIKEDKASATAAPPSNRNAALGNAIGALRKTISLFDRSRLAGDLYAVCALLKRQHDFLRQNATNMERWCRDHFSEVDYASVYVPENLQRRRRATESGLPTSSQRSVLASSGSTRLKVKVVCAGFKKPNTAVGPLVAVLPSAYAVARGLLPAVDPTRAGPVGTSNRASAKRRRSPTAVEMKQSPVDDSAAAAGSVAASTSASAAAALPASSAQPKEVAAPLSYARMAPRQRRKAVSDLVARTARELESKHFQRLDERKQVWDRQELELRKVAREGESLPLHTTAMWRWLDKSGYCSSALTEEDARARLDGLWSPEPATATRSSTTSGSIGGDLARWGRPRLSGPKSERETTPPAATREGGTLFDRLQSLLVEEEERGDEEDDDDDDIYRDLYVEEADLVESSALADLSGLTEDERAFLHVASVGLADPEISPPPAAASALSSSFSCSHLVDEDNQSGSKSTVLKQQERLSSSSGGVAQSPSRPETSTAIASSRRLAGGGDEDDLDDAIEAMTADLHRVNQANNRRLAFLESRQLPPQSVFKAKMDEEASLIARCQQLLKKNKEMKVKNGKPKVSRNDEYALPW